MLRIKPATGAQFEDLKAEREQKRLAFTRTPFADDEATAKNEREIEEESGEKSDSKELKVIVAEEVPWTDLFLDLAMTTAFASLTDGTPMLHRQDALSYACFFVFVWWIWVTQVAYNLRFRQVDWLHRLWVFLQLIVFGALAAFTKNFDITDGVTNNNDEEERSYYLGLLDANNSVAPLNYRDTRLPRLNARGISMTMACSRLLLLVQYGVELILVAATVLYHARKRSKQALICHIIPLVVSSACYFVAYGILGSAESAPSQNVEIAKIVLWYSPIALELISLFVANHLPGHVRYHTHGITSRGATLFVIILGQGLDQITRGFQDIIGNIRSGFPASGIFLSAAVIYICLFSLYFGSPGSKVQMKRDRALAWLLSSFLFLVSLIVTMEAISTCMSFTQLSVTIVQIITAIVPIEDFILSNEGANVTASHYPQANITLSELGFSFPHFVDNLNGILHTNKSQIPLYVQQYVISAMYGVYQLENKAPDYYSLEWAQLEAYIQSNISDLSTSNYTAAFNTLVEYQGSSALWIYPAAGATILSLVLMTLIRTYPRDNWEWINISARASVGFGIAMLALLDIGSGSQAFFENSSGFVTHSNIWRLDGYVPGWILAVIAMPIGVLQIFEIVMAFLANRSYHSLEDIRFGTTRKITSATADQDDRPLAPPPKTQGSSTSMMTRDFSPYSENQ